MSAEQLNGIAEPGIVRNSRGRIVETGWPPIKSDQWPIAHKELSDAVSEQADYERLLRGLPVDNIDRFGTLRYGSGVFNSGRVTLGWRLKDVLDTKFAAVAGTDEKVRYCDIGGGDGSLVINAVLPYRARRSVQGSQLETTMTTLLDYGIRYSGWTAVDRTVETGVELPPDEFYQAFDVISAQNSIYFWSQYPELATLNVAKMLKPGGVFLATLPKKPLDVKNEAGFDPLSYLQSNHHLKVTDVDSDSLEDGHIIEMRKSEAVVEPLKYAELVKPNGIPVSPSQTPCHPRVYNNPAVYTDRFKDRVANTIPDSVRADIEAIEGILGSKTGIKVTRRGIVHGDTILTFDDPSLHMRVSEGKFVEVQYANATIALDTREGHRREFTPYSHPMPLEKLRAYALDYKVESQFDLRIPSWYGNNVMDQGWPLAMYFRNFAIMFNNLGLQEVER